MKKAVGLRIKRIRENLSITRDDVADHLDITNSAYAKIERGDTDMSVTRLESIAGFLKVNVVDFFQDKKEIIYSEDPTKYGFATKAEIEELTQMIKILRIEIEKLKGKPKKKVKGKK